MKASYNAFDAKLFDRIVKDYKKTKSVKDTASNLNTYPIKVRRVLITEGLWKSRSSTLVGNLYKDGYSTSEIAEQLHMSEKNVQSYLPYTRGLYNLEESADSVKSANYRSRKQKVANIAHERMESIQMNNKELKNSIKVASGKEKEQIYKLKLELVGHSYEEDKDYLNLEEMFFIDVEKFLKYSKAKNGISREILVPANMSLHSLHYAINSLFGWQNSHLHNFSVGKKLFSEMTDNRYQEWFDLCGTLFQQIDDDYPDIYWDDDYKTDKSIKTWFKSKYNGPYINYGVCETYRENRKKVNEFIKWIQERGYNLAKLKFHEEEFIMEQDPDYLIGRLTINDVLEPGCSVRISDWKKAVLSNKAQMDEYILETENKASYLLKDMDQRMNELLELRRYRSAVDRAAWRDRKGTWKQLGENPDAVIARVDRNISELEQTCAWALNMLNPKMIPFTDTLYYEYDYGDDWMIKITCEDICEAPENWKGKPICISSDGLPLVDDVGGVSGYYQMLVTLNEENKDGEEYESMRNWARGMGWTGRMVKPEHVL